MADFNVADYESQKELLAAIAEQQADPEMQRKAQAELNEWVETGVRPGDPVANAETREKLVADAAEAGILTDISNDPVTGETIDVSEQLSELDEEAFTEAMSKVDSAEQLAEVYERFGLTRKLI